MNRKSWSDRVEFRRAVGAEVGIPYREIPFYEGPNCLSGTAISIGQLSDPEWEPKGPLEGKYLVHVGVALVIGGVFREVETPHGRLRLARVEVR